MIKTERTIIIPLEKRHLEPLRKMRNDPSTWHWLTSIDLINEVQQEKWFERVSLDPTVKYFAIEENQEQLLLHRKTSTGKVRLSMSLLGVIHAAKWDRVNRSVRIGIAIHPDYKKQGYATEAFGAFIDYLFLQQNIHRVWFMVAEPNEVARKLYQKFGFQEEGRQREALYRDGKYHNYIMMSLLKKDYLAQKDDQEKKLPF